MRVFSSLYGLETLNLRYFNVFGPSQLPERPYAAAIPRFVRAALDREPNPDLRRRRADARFCFIDNAVRANLLASETTNKLSRRGREHRRRAGASRSTTWCARSSVSSARSCDVRFVEPRAGDVKDSLADISRAKELIGYEPWSNGKTDSAPQSSS